MIASPRSLPPSALPSSVSTTPRFGRTLLASFALASALACGEEPRTPTPRLSFTFAPATLTPGQPFAITVKSQDVGVFEVLQDENRVGVVANPSADPLRVPGDFYTYIAKTTAVPRIRAYGDDGSTFEIAPDGFSGTGGSGANAGGAAGAGGATEPDLPPEVFASFTPTCGGIVSVTADTSERCEAEGGTVKLSFGCARKGQILLDVIAREDDGSCAHILKRTSYGSQSLFEEVRAGNLIRVYDLPAMTYVRTYEISPEANAICRLLID